MSTIKERFLDVFAKHIVDKDVKLAEEIKLEQITLEDGTVIEYANLDVATEVFIVKEDGSQEPAPDGDLKINETQILVIKDGKIEEVKEVKEEKKTPSEETKEPVEMQNEISLEKVTDYINLEGLKTLVTNGSISLVVEIKDGQIVNAGYSTFETLQPVTEEVEVEAKSEVEVIDNDNDNVVDVINLKAETEKAKELTAKLEKIILNLSKPIELRASDEVTSVNTDNPALAYAKLLREQKNQSIKF